MSELTNICDWVRIKDTIVPFPEYQTQCGFRFDFPIGGVKDNPEYKFCPFCGKPIKSDDA